MLGTDNIFVNYGAIQSLSDSDAGLTQDGDEASIQNFGSISGHFGILLLGDGGSSDIVNHGTIAGVADGIRVSGQTINLVNTGIISAAVGSGGSDAISILNGGGSFNYITNSGTIIGDINGPGDAELDIINSGLIDGSVFLGSLNDVFDARGGRVTGSVDGGFGDDTYIVDNHLTEITETVSNGTDTVQAAISWTLGDNFEILTLIGSGNFDGYGNGLSNIINGNQGNNVLNGFGSADTLYGGAGDDKVNGGNGIDNLFGGDGDDRLRGQKGFDVLKAEAGDDELYGGQGDDNLFGGDDNDILKGGMGKDKLYGGDDADVFLFTKAAQSKNDSTADKIQDFELGLDTIDLSGVAAGTLTFIAGAAFSGTQGEVQVTGATNSTVLVDVDGDGTADMKISVIGVTGLTEGDFVL
ncbi:MAG: calcium-binding protein [Rhodobacteraceae bacterium]|nr:calcium-binding protein [Paracoccaceae bacterium]